MNTNYYKNDISFMLGLVLGICLPITIVIGILLYQLEINPTDSTASFELIITRTIS